MCRQKGILLGLESVRGGARAHHVHPVFSEAFRRLQVHDHLWEQQSSSEAWTTCEADSHNMCMQNGTAMVVMQEVTIHSMTFSWWYDAANQYCPKSQQRAAQSDSRY